MPHKQYPMQSLSTGGNVFSNTGNILTVSTELQRSIIAHHFDDHWSKFSTHKPPNPGTYCQYYTRLSL